ncbi:MAG: hypothetical protein QM664_01420 [Flavihumibacter sp.]
MTWKKICLLLLFAVMAAYPIYKNFYYGQAITTYERHMALLEKRSSYYNPWQYRVLGPALVEASLLVYNQTIDRLYPIEQKLKPSINTTSRPTEETRQFMELIQKPGAMKYMVVFVLLRWVINVALMYIAFRFFRYFTANIYLVLLMLFLATLAMGNGVLAADLTFNTYLDNCFYLLLGLLVVEKRSALWLLPLTCIAAFNRETSILIPALYFLACCRWQPVTAGGLRHIGWPAQKTWLLVGLSYALFLAIFFSIRAYFGYQPPEVWKVPSGLPMLKLNLLSAVAVKNFFEIYGVIGILPLLVLAGWKYTDDLLKKWFVLLVPVWFAVHLWAVVTYQSRLFLVPTLLLFIPMTSRSSTLIRRRFYRENK